MDDIKEQYDQYAKVIHKKLSEIDAEVIKWYKLSNNAIVLNVVGLFVWLVYSLIITCSYDTWLYFMFPFHCVVFFCIGLSAYKIHCLYKKHDKIIDDEVKFIDVLIDQLNKQ